MKHALTLTNELLDLGECTQKTHLLHACSSEGMGDAWALSSESELRACGRARVCVYGGGRGRDKDHFVYLF